jgi:hypothetical protein
LADSESHGLGDRFVDELETVMKRVAIAPNRFPSVLPGVRRALLAIFPYAVFFREKGDVIFIISCFHSSRDPKIGRTGYNAKRAGPLSIGSDCRFRIICASVGELASILASVKIPRPTSSKERGLSYEKQHSGVSS